MPLKSLYFSFWNNLSEVKKMLQELTDRQLRHTQIFLKKLFLPVYLEDLVFCIKRAGWKVTKIHSHLTFEEKRFKQKFI